ncbi:hypothetical protein Dxin01_00116 [Deinococcus xinjiangensis]|uniref:Uncharacterized protein n=1 Tax=Deinococcus xinjiangensis TaxID=457454 RepID=A0ABP9V7A2_9DEIO
MTDELADLQTQSIEIDSPAPYQALEEAIKLHPVKIGPLGIARLLISEGKEALIKDALDDLLTPKLRRTKGLQDSIAFQEDLWDAEIPGGFDRSSSSSPLWQRVCFYYYATDLL